MTQSSSTIPPVLPAFVTEIIQRLEANGHQAYAVGGCVRDLLLGRQPTDFDITTSASWQQVETLFEKTLPTGSRFGSGTVILPEGSAQVTTYRTEQEYHDKRHPGKIAAAASLEQDLLRRDFTINTLCWNPRQGVVDLLQGCADLRRGLLRCVGSPSLRFQEDALRILRAFRFGCQLGFVIEPQTLSAALALAHTLSWVSAERITEELHKILLSSAPSRAAPLLGVANCLPGGGADTELTALDHCPPRLAARYAALLTLVGGRGTALADASVRLPTRLHRDITLLCSLLAEPPPQGAAQVKRRLQKAGEALLFTYLDTYAALHPQSRQDVDRARRTAWLVLERAEPYLLRHLAINGSDLMAWGAQGAQVGQLLQYLLAQVIEDPARNTPEALRQMAVQRLPAMLRPQNQ